MVQHLSQIALVRATYFWRVSLFFSFKIGISRLVLLVELNPSRASGGESLKPERETCASAAAARAEVARVPPMLSLRQPCGLCPSCSCASAERCLFVEARRAHCSSPRAATRALTARAKRALEAAGRKRKLAAPAAIQLGDFGGSGIAAYHASSSARAGVPSKSAGEN